MYTPLAFALFVPWTGEESTGLELEGCIGMLMVVCVCSRAKDRRETDSCRLQYKKGKDLGTDRTYTTEFVQHSPVSVHGQLYSSLQHSSCNHMAVLGLISR